MREKDLRNLLLQQPVPDEHIVEERTWDVVRAAFVARERVPRARNVPWRLLGLLALVGAGIAIGLTSPGQTIADWVRDTVGRDGDPGSAEPVAEPVGLPAPGQVLVVAPDGVQVVDDGGGTRRLGAYAGAAWSPTGLFVAAWTNRELAAIDPAAEEGLHWQVAQRGVADARWSASGFRVAYLAGESLRVVVGNGTDDRELASPVAPAAPAWRPGPDHVLAYADPQGRVVVLDADSGKVAWRTARAPVPLALEWLDGERLAVLSEQRLRVFRAPRELVADVRVPRRLYAATALAARPGGTEIAYAVHARRSGQGTVLLWNGRFSRALFSGPGRLDDLTWSPDGRLLLVPWEAADQWLFVPAEGGEVVAQTGVRARFGAGAAGAAFPRVEGWCCAPAAAP